MAKKKFTVEVEIPDGMDADDMAAYIEESVRTWSGSKDPQDPIYGLDRGSVKVTVQRRRRSENVKSSGD